MKTEYAHAILQMIKEGVSVDTALSGLRAVLEKKGHNKLFVPILREALRIIQSEKDSIQAVVATARKEDDAVQKQIEATLKALGVQENTSIKKVIDDTLIGGFVVTYEYKEYDQSYKKALRSLYESITK
jgi:F0F1-type ATP synthase delta subunit